jgi:hypothetical protein
MSALAAQATRGFGKLCGSAQKPSKQGWRSHLPEGGAVYLEVTLINGQNYSIPVENGHSLEEELELFLTQDGRYGSGWVPLEKSGRKLFVRYDQIVLVSPKA